MKTSRKLIIVFFSIILFVILYTLVHVRILMQGAQRDMDLPDFSSRIKKEIPVESFHSVVVNFPVHVFYRQSQTSSLEYNLDERTQRNINLYVKDQVLYLDVHSDRTQSHNSEIYITSDSLILLNVNKHSWFDADRIQSNSLEIQSNNSTVRANLDVQNVMVHAINDSKLNLEGKIGTATIKLNNMAVLNGDNLKTNKAYIEAYDHSDVTIGINEFMEVTLTDKSKLKYKGEPVVSKMNIESSSTIEKLD